MIATTVKYDVTGNLLTKLDAMEKKLAHFDAMIDKSDKHLNKFGKGGKGGNLLDKIIGNNKSINSITDSLASIPNLNSGILNSAGSLANPYVAAGAAVVALGGYTLDAIQYSQQWDKTMAKVNVTAGMGQIELKGLSDRISELAENSTTEFQQVPDAFNQILSGVGDVDKSLDLLQYALKGAQAGFTDINTVSEAGVNIMNSVGNKVSGAKEVYDVLFATLNKGKGEFKDIADYLPRIIPYSNQLGTSFKETSAMFALMTASGQTTEQTTMLLQNAFTNLLDGKKRSKLEQFVKIFDDSGRVREMKDIIGEMSTKLEGMSDRSRVNLLEKFGFDTQAAGAFSVLTQNADRLEGFIDYIANSSANGGALAKAVDDSANAAQNIDLIHNKWNSWKKDWGSANGWWTSFTAAGLESMTVLEQSLEGFTIAMRDSGMLLKRSFGWMKDNDEGTFFTGAQNKEWNDYKFGETSDEKKQDAINTQKLNVFSAKSKLLNKFAKGKNWDDVKDDVYAKANKEFGKDKVDKFFNTYHVTPSMMGLAEKKENATKDPFSKSEQQEKDEVKASKTSARLAKKQTAKSIHEVAGGGNQVRNITVHIGKQIETVRIETTNLQGQSTSQIKKILETLLVESVRDSELALAH